MELSDFVFLLCVCSQGETSVATATNCPVWNEEISFIEQFPPLAQRIKVQILDDSKMGDIALATHYLDLQQISDPTRNGTSQKLHNVCFVLFFNFNSTKVSQKTRKSNLNMQREPGVTFRLPAHFCICDLIKASKVSWSRSSCDQWNYTVVKSVLKEEYQNFLFIYLPFKHIYHHISVLLSFACRVQPHLWPELG